MELQKAIEVQNDLLCWQEVQPYPDVKDAIKLGIEALKRIDYCRSGEFEGPFELLPGETKE